MGFGIGFLNELSPAEEAKFRKLLPNVRFNIPSGSESLDDDLDYENYRKFLGQLLHDFRTNFLRKEDPPTNTRTQLHLGDRSGEEGGLSDVQVNNHFVSHCKVFWYGDLESLVISDHEYLGAVVSRDIHAIADAFEKFLRQKNIAYTRFLRRRGSHEEGYKVNI